MASPSAGQTPPAAPAETSPGEAGDLPAEGPEGTAARVKRIRKIATDSGLNSTQRSHDLYLSITALTRADFARLLADPPELELLLDEASRPSISFFQGYLSAVLGHWLELEPDLSSWGAPVLLALRQNAGEQATDFFAKKQPEKTLGFLASVQDPGARSWIILKGLAELRRQSPAKARAWREAHRSDPAAELALADRALRRGAVLENPLAAVELARATKQSEPKTEEAEYLLDLAVKQAGAMGPGTLRQLATEPMEGWMLGRLLPRLAEADPGLAVDLALQSHARGDEVKPLVPLEFTDSLLLAQTGDPLAVVFGALATRDLSAALERVAEVPGPARGKVNTAIAQQWAQRDPGAALTWLGQRPLEERMNLRPPLNNPNPVKSPDTMAQLLGDWVETDPAAAQAWAAALPPGSFERMEAHMTLAQQFARRGDARQALAAATEAGAKTADPEMLGQAAAGWALRDPQAAANWVTTLPTGPAQSRAVAAVVESWSMSDPTGVQAWLAEFPPGEARDLSIAAFLQRPAAFARTPAQATAEFDRWIGAIDDPWQRSLVVRNQFLMLKKRDAAAARAWLQTGPNLDPELKRMLLRRSHR